MKQNRMKLIIIVLISIAANVILYYFMYNLGLPLYFDTIGTIFVSIIAGPFFGILTGFVTNTLGMFNNIETIYYSSINSLVAIATYSYFRKYTLNRISYISGLTIRLALLTGFLSTAVQWTLSDFQTSLVGNNAYEISEISGIPVVIPALILNILINIPDKGISIVVVRLVLRLFPEDFTNDLQLSTLMQAVRPTMELDKEKKGMAWIRHSVRTRETMTLIMTSTIIVFAMSCIGLRLFYQNEKMAMKENVYNAAAFVAELIDPKLVDRFNRNGINAVGYSETEKLLIMIRDSVPEISSLRLTEIKEDGHHVIYDLAKDDIAKHNPGSVVPFEEGFLPYVAKGLAGDEIEPIEDAQITKWTYTVFYPVKDDEGKTVCYVSCYVMLVYLAGYMARFMLKVLFILAGLYLLLVAYELWRTSITTTYPITAMTECVDHFSDNGDDQSSLDENVKKIRALDIRTGDEIEKLYNTICDMTLDQAEQMRNIRRLSDSTMKMQDGLIITMADMVESRDSDTGAHVQKTAAYVKIIVEGLKEKGYYPEKINAKFISDVVRSAPLHDVGKINISDRILNKPGKLTDEEFEIMKTHTTAGKEIMEKAIYTVKGGSYLKEARNMAAYHHERWDGKGYPDGLHGEVIPLSARIMAVADVFDALTSKRVYKPAFELDKALEILKEGSGTQFDPKCIEVFLEAVPEIKVILKKYNQL